MITNVYIDAFNFYYGCTRNTPYRWCNLLKLCQILLPDDEIRQVKLFTARVSGFPTDPDQPSRQETYFRALRTCPQISIIYGQFRTRQPMMPRADSPPDKMEFVRVIKQEEKGSDVNLAAHLLRDGFLNDYELAVVISNDSDLLEPIRIVREDIGKPVGILNPNKHPAQLSQHATFVKNIREGVLKLSQFPDELEDETGKFQRPERWR